MLKILFLDIDGVLNDGISDETAGTPLIDQKKILLLNQIILATQCQLVISSEWRNWIISGDMTLDGFKMLLRSHGLSIQTKMHGITNQGKTRWDKIMTYLNQITEPYEWCILDDLSPERMGLPPTKTGHTNWIQTDIDTGLLAQDVQAAITILNWRDTILIEDD